jgi:hypothetical protein
MSQKAYWELIPFIFLCFSAPSMHNISEMSTNTRTFLEGQAQYRVKSINGFALAFQLPGYNIFIFSSNDLISLLKKAGL